VDQEKQTRIGNEAKNSFNGDHVLEFHGRSLGSEVREASTVDKQNCLKTVCAPNGPLAHDPTPSEANRKLSSQE
jgi:hypothetical protein